MALLSLLELNRLCRSLTSSVLHAATTDPLDDPTVDALLAEIRQTGSAGRACQMLGALTLFAFDRLKLSTLAEGAVWSLDSLKTAMLGENTLDPSLLVACFDILREMSRSPRDADALRHVVTQGLREWGPYLLVTQVIITLRIGVTVAEGRPGISVEELLQGWALADERNLGRFTT